MKAVPLRIEVMTPEEEHESMVRIVEDQLARARRGEKVTPVRRLIFPNFDVLRSFLTQGRLDLLRLIRSEKPDSIYALSKLAGRDRKAVTTDLDVLVDLGLVTMTKSQGEGRARSVPHVPYTRIDIRVEV